MIKKPCVAQVGSVFTFLSTCFQEKKCKQKEEQKRSTKIVVEGQGYIKSSTWHRNTKAKGEYGDSHLDECQDSGRVS